MGLCPPVCYPVLGNRTTQYQLYQDKWLMMLAKGSGSTWIWSQQPYLHLCLRTIHSWHKWREIYLIQGGLTLLLSHISNGGVPLSSPCSCLCLFYYVITHKSFSTSSFHIVLSLNLSSIFHQQVELCLWFI